MEQHIYLGPAVAPEGFSLPHGTIFRGNLPPAVSRLAASDSDFSLLLVKPDQVARARQDIAAEGSYLSGCYLRVMAKYGKAGVKS